MRRAGEEANGERKREKGRKREKERAREREQGRERAVRMTRVWGDEEERWRNERSRTTISAAL